MRGSPVPLMEPPYVRRHSLPQIATLVRTAEALACDLPAEAVARRAPDTEALFARARERKALSDGAIFVFPDDETARALFEFVAIERRCCAQLTYELARQPRWVCE